MFKNQGCMPGCGGYELFCWKTKNTIKPTIFFVLMLFWEQSGLKFSKNAERPFFA
jgi:hypothetical protein